MRLSLDNVPARLRLALSGNWRRRMSGASLILFLTQAFLFVLGLALSIVLARTLQPTGRGQYAIIMLVPALLVQFVDPCFSNSIIFFNGQKKFTAMQLAAAGVRLALVAGGVAFLMSLVAISVPPVSGWLGPSLGRGGANLALASVITVSFVLTTQYCGTILLGANRVIEFNMTRLVAPTVQLVLVVSIALSGRFNLGSAVYAYVGAAVAGGFFAVWAATRIVGSRPRELLLTLDRRVLKETIPFGLRGYAARFCAFGALRLDAFLIAALMSSADVGIYMVGVALAERISMIPEAIATALLPRVASLGADATSMTTMATRNTLFSVGLTSAFLALIARPLVVTLYGVSYGGAALALVALLPGIAALSISGVVSSYITGKGHPEYGILPALLSLIVNVGANLYLIPRLGILGAALASTLSYTMAGGCFVAIFMRMSGATLSDLLFLRRSDLLIYVGFARSFLRRVRNMGRPLIAG